MNNQATRFGLWTMLIVLMMISGRADADNAVHDLADKMLAAYQQIETYQATWDWHFVTLKKEHTEGKAPPERLKVKVVFDRKTKRCLIMGQGFRGEQDKRPTACRNYLFLNDGKKFHRAFLVEGMRDESWKKDEIDAPESFTSRDFRRFMHFFQLFTIDLPLLFGEHPLERWLEPQIGETVAQPLLDTEITALPRDAEDKDRRPGIRFDEISFSVRLDPQSFLILEGGYDEKMKFICKSVMINQPLQPDAFNFENHLKVLDIKKE